MSKLQPSQRLRLQPLGGPAQQPFSILEDGPIMIGRSHDCHVCLSDPKVSRHHAALVRRGEEWFLTDLGSRSGSHINGTALKPQTPAQVSARDMIRIGPYAFQVQSGPVRKTRTTTEDMPIAPGTVVERTSTEKLESLATRRLELLMDGATTMHNATDEAGLARAILDVTLDGTGFQRAAVFRNAGRSEGPEAIAYRELRTGSTSSFTLSQSLLQEACDGQVVRVFQAEAPNLAHSISRLGIHSAVCCPVFMDSSVIGCIYSDSRELETEPYPDAVGFCHAIARLAGLSFAGLKRLELEVRQSRLEKDLNAARHVQSFLGPQAQGRVGHLLYAMRMHPGRFVAGDLFDIFPLDDDRVGVCFGDVSGQGMAAAIFMTAVLAHGRATLARYGEPAKATVAMNQYLTNRSAQDMFVSLFLGVFDRAKGVLEFVDAGHGHWLIRRHGQAPEPAPMPQGLLVGIDASQEYEARQIEMRSGDRIILFSDGVVEHRNTQGQDFGRNRLIESIAGAGDVNEDVTLALTALEKFIGQVGLADDTSLASIAVEGGTE